MRTKQLQYLITDTGAWSYETETEKEIFEALATDTDRAAAIIAGSIIDIRLDVAIRNRLKRDDKVEDALFSAGQPLGSFTAKINLAYLMGIIGSEARDDAHTIRKIRNLFAHDLSIRDFASQSIKDRVRTLHMIETHAVHRVEDGSDQLVVSIYPNAIPRVGINNLNSLKDDPRSRYLICCSIIVSGLATAEACTEGQLT